jgi:bifunctional UDP-N-acetylglucosamine pyrophosphorylase / glucosamine-1-phosphate N-acetyltransferase
MLGMEKPDMIAVAVLAAGKGTRMKSTLPKVLHSLGGRSLVEWVLYGLSEIQPSRQLVIVGYQGELVKQALQHWPGVEFVEQAQQLGTGHAVQQLLPHLQDFQGNLIVLNGDVPLMRPETLKLLLDTHEQHQNAATVLTAQIPDPTGYGRVICDGNNILKQIVEHRDCTTAQRQNRRVNAGIYCFRWADLAKVLPQLQSNNDQQEYYLTDVVTMLSPVMAVDVDDYEEILGINDRKQLAGAYEILQNRIKDRWMAAGVTMIDPSSTTIDDTVKLEADVVIEPQTHLRGQTSVQAGSRIGPGSLIENSQIADNVTVSFSVVTDSHIGSGSRVGPYAHLRNHVDVGANCRIGNFVELKAASLGQKTNVAHLSYLGDASLGNQVNIGGGTITANYDGKTKHRTVLGDRSKTGVNNSLVAPLSVGQDVTIAAGSTITEDLPDDCLAIGRARQVIKPGWRLAQPSAQPTTAPPST